MTTFRTKNPTTGGLLNTYEYATRWQIQDHVKAATTAFESWHLESLEKRVHLANDLADVLLKNLKNVDPTQSLAVQSTVTMGKPIEQSRKEIEKSATCCRYYAIHAARFLENENIEMDNGRAISYVAFRPLGTILCIMPWNFPVWQVVRFAVPALIAGNTVLLKHADNTTGVGKILEEIFQSIFPKNCFQLVLANHEQIAEVIADPRVAAVTLTGSERAGREVAAQAGKFLKKSVLELGGSDAYVILDDANIEKAAAICAEARLVNNGQSCVAAKRFIVHEKVHKLFVEALCANFKKKIVGDPLNEKMDIGPLAREDLRRDLAIQVEKSIAMGAKSVTGERNSVAPGFFYNPTILTDVKPGMPAFDEETFGPVAAVIKVQNEEEAIKLANLSRYGLGGAIFSENEERAEYLAREKLEVGFAAVNTNVVSDSRLPFGGIKNSGYGRELGSFGIKEFVNIKTISIRR